MTEIEAKFLLRDARQSDDVLRALGRLGYHLREGPRTRIRDRYVDTPDWRILRAGWACRRRREGDGARLVLKSVAGGEGPVFTREEVEQPLTKTWRPGRALPPGPVRDALGEGLDGRETRELFRLRTRRCLFDVAAADDADTDLELAIDHTRIVCDGSDQAMDFFELEVELRRGSADAVGALAGVLANRIGLVGARMSKFERGLQAAGHQIAVPPAAAEEAPLTRESAMLDLAYASLRRNLAKLKINAPRAWEGLHPEGVHQMRVAIRRLRAALKTFRDLLPKKARKHFNAELRWLARSLGAVRDADVYGDNIATYMTGLPERDAEALSDYLTHLDEIKHRSRQHLLTVLAGERYAALVDALDGFTTKGPSRARRRRLGGPTIGAGALDRVRPPVEKMLRQGAAIDDDTADEQLHRLRLQGKRVRSQTEFFVEFFPEALKPLVKAGRRLQNVLGEHQDAVVACERLRHYADALPPSDAMRRELLVLGRLVQIQARHGREERARFPKFWRRFEKAARDAL